MSTTLPSTLSARAAAPADEIENQRGRYAFHVHRTGGEDAESSALAKGNVVFGSPGWGMVHHDSNADFLDNIVVGARGAGKVAENGGETRRWIGNLVTSTGQRPGDEANPVIPGGKIARSLLDDDFREGFAYAFQSRIVLTVDNVAASSQGGFKFSGSTDFEPLKAEVTRDDLPFDAFPLDETIEPDAPALLGFTGNEVLSSRFGFTSQGRMEAGGQQLQSIVQDFDAWNIDERAIYMASNFGYIFEDMTLIGDGDGLAILLLHDDDDIHFIDVTIRDMATGVADGEPDRQGNPANHPDSVFIFLDVDFGDIEDPFADFEPAPIVLTRSALSDATFAFEGNENLDTTIDVAVNDWTVTIDGTISDSVGSYGFGHLDRVEGAMDRRTYDFTDKLDGYLARYGLDRDGSEATTSLVEFMADRITGELHGITFRIDILGLDPDYVSAGNDRLRAGPQDATLEGGAGDDRIEGAGGNDLLLGDEGNDTFIASSGRDHVDGGAGEQDMISMELAAFDRPVKVLLNEGRFRGWEGDGWSVVENVENIAGSSGRDVLFGDQRANRIEGGDGDDQLRGYSGDDILDGGSGDDRLEGGRGDDLLEGGDGGDTLAGGSGDDTLVGGGGADLLEGGEGADIFVFGAPFDHGDTILDFSVDEGDRIALAGEQPVVQEQVGEDLHLLCDGELVARLIGVSELADDSILAS